MFKSNSSFIKRSLKYLFIIIGGTSKAFLLSLTNLECLGRFEIDVSISFKAFSILSSVISISTDC